MNTKRLLIIFLLSVLLIFASIVFFQKHKKTEPLLTVPESTPSIEDNIKEKVKWLSIPEDADVIELKNVSGEEGMGIATKSEIIADLPNLAKGEKYQVFIEDGSKTVLLGNLENLKGGWILEYDLSKYQDYKKIVVVKNGRHVLEGSY